MEFIFFLLNHIKFDPHTRYVHIWKVRNMYERGNGENFLLKSIFGIEFVREEMKGIDKTFLEPKLCCLGLWAWLYQNKSDSITSIIMILHIPTPLYTGKRKGFGVRRDKDRIIINSTTLIFSSLTPLFDFVVKKRFADKRKRNFYLFIIDYWNS